MKTIYQKATTQKRQNHSRQATQNDILISLFNVNAEKYLRRVERLSFPSLHDITGLEIACSSCIYTPKSCRKITVGTKKITQIIQSQENTLQLQTDGNQKKA